MGETLSIAAAPNRVMVNRVLVALNLPDDGGAGPFGVNTDAVINSAFDLGALFIIVPGDQLDTAEAGIAAVVFAEFIEGGQPGLAAVLVEDAVRAPTRKSVVKPLIAAAYHRIVTMFLTGGIEGIQVRLAPVIGVGGVDIDPAEAAVGLRSLESDSVAENEYRAALYLGSYFVPVHRVDFQAEEKDGRMAVDLDVGRGLRVMADHVIQVVDNLLGHVATCLLGAQLRSTARI